MCIGYIIISSYLQQSTRVKVKSTQCTHNHVVWLNQIHQTLRRVGLFRPEASNSKQPAHQDCQPGRYMCCQLTAPISNRFLMKLFGTSDMHSISDVNRYYFCFNEPSTMLEQ